MWHAVAHKRRLVTVFAIETCVAASVCCSERMRSSTTNGVEGSSGSHKLGCALAGVTTGEHVVGETAQVPDGLESDPGKSRFLHGRGREESTKC
jgi:hypothetical protein